MIVDRYFYGKLPENEKKIYKEIYQGCMEHRDTIPLSCSSDEIKKSYQRIIEAITDDNPLLYFLNQTVMEIAVDSFGNAAVLPQYFITKDSVERYNDKMQNTINNIISRLKLTEGSDYDRIKRVHDYMCENVKYDYEGSDPTNTKSFILSHTIIGVFANKKAQCEGIAKAAKVLLNAVDMKCIFITGTAKGDHFSNGAHGWNIVSIDGNPYHMDITYDIGGTKHGFIDYDYLNLTDNMIRRDHVFKSVYPKCTSTQMNYFTKNGRLFDTKKGLREYVAHQINAGEMDFYVRFGGKLKVGNIYQEIMDYAYTLLCDKGKEKVKGYRMVNKALNTLRFWYM